MTKEYNNKKLFVLGPNPAWQVTLFFNDLRLGEVNRAIGKKAFASGKGINFCRAAATTELTPLLFHFSGGYTGELINRGVVDEKIEFHTVNVESESRVCTTCLGGEGTDMTELIEPSGRISGSECDELLQKLTADLAECAGIALCGTVPPGAEQLYRRVAEIAQANRLPLLVDACQHVEEFLNIGKITLKVNAEEIKAIAGERSITAAMKIVFERYQLHCIAVTDGAKGAYLYDGVTLFSYHLPQIGNIVSSLGAGDSCSAIFACRLLEGLEPCQAFAAGLATASASCLTDSCAKFATTTAGSLEQQIEISHEEF